MANVNPATTLTRPLPSTICRRDRVGDQIEIPRATEPLMFRGGVPVRELPKVHPHEIGRAPLEALGFRPAGRHLLYATDARSA